MALNKRKILEAARKYAQKGAQDRALKEYEKLLKLDPRDAKLRLEIGDAYRRWGQVDEAVAAYTRVAEQYMDEGFDARAVAVFKQIQNLDAERYTSYLPLAELYQRMGLTSEAIGALQTAADGYHREGRKRDALDLLRRMAGLDPTNTTSRIKVADLLRQEKLNDEAIAEYQEAHAELERQGEREAAGAVLERILELDPKRLPVLVAMAKNLLARGQAPGAESFARRALELDADETDHYELLADVYRAQGRDSDLAQTYRKLAELYRRRGDEDRARDILQRFVPASELADALPSDGGFDAGSPFEREGPSLLDDDALLGGDFLARDGTRGSAGGLDLAEQTVLDAEPELDLGEPVRGTTRQLDAELEEDGAASGDVDQLLAEASVYLRYGKRAQALKNLSSILARQPKHVAALEKLGEAHADAGDARAAVDAWLRAAEHARADADAETVALLRDRIAALDPGAAQALGGPPPEPEPDVEIVDFGDEAATDGEADASAPSHGEIEIEIEDEPETPAPSRAARAAAPKAAPAKPAAPAAAGASASASASQKIQEELEEAEFYRQQGLLDEAEAIYQRVLQAAPNHPLALVRLGEIVAARGEDPGISGSGATPPEPEPAGEVDADIGSDLADWSDGGLDEDLAAASAPAPSPRGRAVAEDTDEDLGLADSAPEMGLEDDVAAISDVEIDVDLGDEEREAAEESDPGEITGVDGLEAPAALEDDDTDTDVPQPAAARDDGPPTAVERPAFAAAEPADDEEEDEDDHAPASAPEPLAAQAGGDGGEFDLASVLNDALDDGDGASGSGRGADDGFEAVFSAFKKGVSKTLGAGDTEAHYDLGIAYREMGLLEDAMGEFQLASASPARRIESLQMLGMCALDLGRAQQAREQLEAALGEKGISDVQALAARFELGRACEALGDVAAARAAWEQVAASDPGFCEVEERLAALGQKKPEPPAADKNFESFGDLFENLDGEAAAQVEEPEADEPEHEAFEDLIAEAAEDDDEGEQEPPPPPKAPEPRRPAPEPAPRRKKKISFV